MAAIWLYDFACAGSGGRVNSVIKQVYCVVVFTATFALRAGFCCIIGRCVINILRIPTHTLLISVFKFFISFRNVLFFIFNAQEKLPSTNSSSRRLTGGEIGWALAWWECMDVWWALCCLHRAVWLSTYSTGSEFSFLCWVLSSSRRGKKVKWLESFLHLHDRRSPQTSSNTTIGYGEIWKMNH